MKLLFAENEEELTNEQMNEVQSETSAQGSVNFEIRKRSNSEEFETDDFMIKKFCFSDENNY